VGAPWRAPPVAGRFSGGIQFSADAGRALALVGADAARDRAGRALPLTPEDLARPAVLGEVLGTPVRATRLTGVT